MRNALGQKIDIGSPAVIDTQYNDIKFGRIDKFNKKGHPQIRYVNDDDGNRVSPGIVNYRRILIISEDELDRLTAHYNVRVEAGNDFDALHPATPMPSVDYDDPAWKQWSANYSRRHEARRDAIDDALVAAGYEPFYRD